MNFGYSFQMVRSNSRSVDDWGFNNLWLKAKRRRHIVKGDTVDGIVAGFLVSARWDVGDIGFTGGVMEGKIKFLGHKVPARDFRRRGFLYVDEVFVVCMQVKVYAAQNVCEIHNGEIKAKCFEFNYLPSELYESERERYDASGKFLAIFDLI
jgi:hypothetical protein